MDSRVQEFIRIRNRFKASRAQFGEVFLGVTGAVVTNYEREITPIPEPVMKLARVCEKFLDELEGKQNGDQL